MLLSAVVLVRAADALILASRVAVMRGADADAVQRAVRAVFVPAAAFDFAADVLIAGLFHVFGLLSFFSSMHIPRAIDAFGVRFFAEKQG